MARVKSIKSVAEIYRLAEKERINVETRAAAMNGPQNAEKVATPSHTSTLLASAEESKVPSSRRNTRVAAPAKAGVESVVFGDAAEAGGKKSALASLDWSYVVDIVLLLR